MTAPPKRRSLPYTWLWTYEGTHAGPTIEAKRGGGLCIARENDLTGAYPPRRPCEFRRATIKRLHRVIRLDEDALLAHN